MPIPEFLEIERRPKETMVWGDLPKDETFSGFKPGGPGYYIAIVYNKLDIKVKAVSSIGLDYPEEMLPPNLTLIRSKPTSERSMVYRNIYENGVRTQFAELNDCSAFPTLKEISLTGFLITENQEILFITPLRPVSTELVSEICKNFSDSTKVGLIQGWSRRIARDGKVLRRDDSLVDHDIEMIKGDFDIIIFSDEDIINALFYGKKWSMAKNDKKAPIVVVTENIEGCTIFINGKGEHLPAYKIGQINDPTGAGDRFAAFFAFMYRITGNPIYSARFANAGTAYALHHGNNSIQLEEIFNFAGDLWNSSTKQ